MRRQRDPSPTPDQALKEFARKLPDTIKEAVLVRCIGPFGLFRLDPDQDLYATFCSILDDAEHRYLAAECAKLIGVMELALQHSRGDEKFYGELAEQTGSPIAKGLAMRAPLRDRHFEGALAKFSRMRSTVLSPRSLYIWQLRLEVGDLAEQDDR